MRVIKYHVLTFEINKSVIVDGLILFHIRLVDLRVMAWFGIVTLLTFPLLFETSCIDRLFSGISPQEPKVVPFHSYPVSIVDTL